MLSSPSLLCHGNLGPAFFLELPWGHNVSRVDKLLPQIGILGLESWDF